MAEPALLITTNAPIPSRGSATVIIPASSGLLTGLSDFWKHRSLLYVFIWRNLKVRYKQTFFGAGWTVLQPFLTTVVFTLVFGRLAKVPSGGVPYPVFVFCGLLPWQFFAQGLIRSSNSLVEERYLLTRIYVPRLILPVSAVLSGLPDFGVTFVVLLAMMLYYGIAPTAAMLAVLPLLALAVATAVGASLFLSALNVRFRDVGHTIPFFAQLWFFVTPVSYPSSLVPERWRTLYQLNPMTGVVEGFRWALVGSPEATGNALAASVAVVALMVAAGVIYFQRLEKTFADVV